MRPSSFVRTRFPGPADRVGHSLPRAIRGEGGSSSDTPGGALRPVSFRVEDDHGWHGALPIHETFTMRRPADVFTRELYDRGEAGTLRIACVESSHGSPTEIAAHVAWDSGWGSRPLFRIDVDGRHGDRPRRGKRFIEMVGDLRVEVEILDVKMIEAGPWRPERIDWIRFAVRVERA